MSIVLVIAAFLLLVTGLLGSVIPALPGPPLSFIGLLLIHFAGYGNFSVPFLVILGVITIVIMVTDNLLPAWMTRLFGGSKKAVIGSVIGLIAGMIFFAPIGIFAGPFLGALAGELINNSIQAGKQAKAAKLTRRAGDPEMVSGNIKKTNPLKVAWGAFLAFITGTGAKLILGGFMIYFAVKAVF